MRKIKNRGAIVVLVWNFFIASVFYYIIEFVIILNGLAIIAVAWRLTLPFAGWIADIQFGRYRMIRWSMWIMWTASLLITATSAVEQIVVPSHYNTFKLNCLSDIGFYTGYWLWRISS